MCKGESSTNNCCQWHTSVRLQGGGGGAVYVQDAPVVSIRNTAFANNTAVSGSGGAVRLKTVGQLALEGVTLVENEVGLLLSSAHAVSLLISYDTTK